MQKSRAQRVALTSRRPSPLPLLGTGLKGSLTVAKMRALQICTVPRDTSWPWTGHAAAQSLDFGNRTLADLTLSFSPVQFDYDHDMRRFRMSYCNATIALRVRFERAVPVRSHPVRCRLDQSALGRLRQLCPLRSLRLSKRSARCVIDAGGMAEPFPQHTCPKRPASG